MTKPSQKALDEAESLPALVRLRLKLTKAEKERDEARRLLKHQVYMSVKSIELLEVYLEEAETLLAKTGGDDE